MDDFLNDLFQEKKVQKQTISQDLRNYDQDAVIPKKKKQTPQKSQNPAPIQVTIMKKPLDQKTDQKKTSANMNPIVQKKPISNGQVEIQKKQHTKVDEKQSNERSKKIINSNSVPQKTQLPQKVVKPVDRMKLIELEGKKKQELLRKQEELQRLKNSQKNQVTQNTKPQPQHPIKTPQQIFKVLQEKQISVQKKPSEMNEKELEAWKIQQIFSKEKPKNVNKVAKQKESTQSQLKPDKQHQKEVKNKEEKKKITLKLNIEPKKQKIEQKIAQKVQQKVNQISKEDDQYDLNDSFIDNDYKGVENSEDEMEIQQTLFKLREQKDLSSFIIIQKAKCNRR